MKRKPQYLIHAIAAKRGWRCCFDGGCVLGHPGGMQTNGGCATDRHSLSPHELMQRIKQLHFIAQELGARVIELEGDK